MKLKVPDLIELEQLLLESNEKVVGYRVNLYYGNKVMKLDINIEDVEDQSLVGYCVGSLWLRASTVRLNILCTEEEDKTGKYVQRLRDEKTIRNCIKKAIQDFNMKEQELAY